MYDGLSMQFINIRIIKTNKIFIIITIQHTSYLISLLRNLILITTPINAIAIFGTSITFILFNSIMSK